MNNTIVRRKIIEVALCMLVVSLISSAATQPVNAISIEYVGRDTVNQWVPYFILYDPPGDQSYAEVFQTTTNALEVALHGSAFGTGGEVSFSGSFISSQGDGTPVAEHMSCVLAYQYRIVWDVYYYESPVASWYRAYLVSATPISGSDAIIRFDNCASCGILVNDQTGQPGTYNYSRRVDKNCYHTDELEYTWDTSIYFNIGLEFEYAGWTFSAGIYLKRDSGSALQIKYYESDTNTNLIFNISSNVNIDFSLPQPNAVNNVQVWFSE